jgi:hypothetical protein
MCREKLEPLKLSLIKKVMDLARDIKVYDLTEIARHRATFISSWRAQARVAIQDIPSTYIPYHVIDNPNVLAREIKGSRKWPLTSERLQEEFALAKTRGEGIWTVMTMDGPNELFLEVVRYKRSGTADPVSEVDFMNSYLSKRNPLLGVLRTDALVSVLDKFPGLPHAAIFTGESMGVWLRTTKRQFPDACILCSVLLNLTQIGIELALAGHGIRNSAGHFNIGLTELQRGFYFADRNQLGSYVLQKVQGHDMLSLIHTVTDSMNVQYMEDAKEIVPHWTLLKAMVIHLFSREIWESKILDLDR